MDSMIGLSSTEAAAGLKQFGYNEIKEVVHSSILKILFHQISHNFVIWLLFLAVIFSFFAGEEVTGFTIVVVVLVVILVGFIQEYRAEKSISALRKLIVPSSLVIRDGREKEVNSREIVPNDILLLRTGERIPADCILLEAIGLRVDESILTGESKEITKNDNNLLFMGTYITCGKCTARVLHTGMNTRFGKIAKMIQTTEKQLPLQDKINNISLYMVIIATAISVLTGAMILLRSTVITQDVLVGIMILVIALCVSAFPEGFPLVLITTLAVGAGRMVKQNAIISRMSVLETLGETTVICSDKTGTITEGEMTVKKIVLSGQEFEVSGDGDSSKGEILYEQKTVKPEQKRDLNLLIKTGILCNDAKIELSGEDNTYRRSGNFTEGSLLILGAKAKLFREDFKHIREEELPFSSERKMMSVLCREGQDYFVYSKGALEKIIEKCKYVQNNGQVVELTAGAKNKILEVNKKITKQSYRTLALAYKTAENGDLDFLEEDLIFLGFVGMEDPPRQGVTEAILTCKLAGIRVKMITGDNKETAMAIASQVGLTGTVLEGEEIDSMSDDELAIAADGSVIFARVRPEHKLRIVSVLKRNGEVVTMTGDGVNDAPALKEAQVGIAMGKNGTDVSRSVADLTLKDDHFATIVVAIREGRTIFNNIRKFISYQLSCNIAELLVLFLGAVFAPYFGWQTPILLALQILFMNLVTDDLPAITLGLNPSSADVMLEKPRRKTKIIDKKLFVLILFSGLLMSVFTMAVFYICFNLYGMDINTARTSALLALILLEIAAAFVFRSFRKPVLSRSPFVNRYLVLASLLSIIFTLAIIYTPLKNIFETSSLGFINWALAMGAVLLLLLVFDVLKLLMKRTGELAIH